MARGGSEAVAAELKMDVGKVKLGIDSLVPCGLIINELLSNSIKYAFKDGREGRINIVFRSDGPERTLLVSDNGIGLPEGLDIESVETLGLILVNSLVQQLRGNLEINTDEGTAYSITFAEPE